jgi:hypothetical protein
VGRLETHNWSARDEDFVNQYIPTQPYVVPHAAVVHRGIDATLGAQEKAIIFMRYIRNAIEEGTFAPVIKNRSAAESGRAIVWICLAFPK